MRRRRGILVKLFNLVYIAAAGISIYALCTRPIIKANVHVHFEKEKMGNFLSGIFNRFQGSNSESEEEGEEVKLIYRTEARAEIKDYITKEKIESYFPNGYDVDLPLEISAKHAFNFNNKQLLDDLIQLNLGTIVDNVFKSIEKPIGSLFRDIVEGFAIDTLKDEINKQIAQYFPDGDPATDAEVQQIFDDVYSLLDEGETVSVDTLAETILHGKDGESGVLDIINSRGCKYVAWDPQPSEAEVTADLSAAEGEGQYFLQVAREPTFEHNTSAWVDGRIYYHADGTAWDPQPEEEAVNADIEAAEGEELYYVGVVTYSYKHNDLPYDEHTTYFKATPYTNDDIDDQKIAEQMTQSLEGIDGLVTKVPHPCEPQPTEQQVIEDLAKEEKDRIYYVLDGNGDPVLPEAYDSSATYYTVEKVVNDIDAAMAALMDSFLNGSGSGSGKAVMREEEAKLDSEKESKSMTDSIKDYLYSMIPSNITSSTGKVGENAPYILLALIALFALPWAWFALVTILRTLRRTKCWTRPMIVLFWCFPQLIFGIGLTYGTKYIFPYLAERIQGFSDYANSFNFDIRTGCLIPSFVYLGVFAMTILYWIVRRPMKVQYKMEKRVGRGSRRPRQPRQPKQPKEKRVPGEPRKPRQPRQPLIPYDDQYNNYY